MAMMPLQVHILPVSSLLTDQSWTEYRGRFARTLRMRHHAMLGRVDKFIAVRCYCSSKVATAGSDAILDKLRFCGKDAHMEKFSFVVDGVQLDPMIPKASDTRLSAVVLKVH